MLKRLQKATKDLFSNFCCDSGSGLFCNYVFFYSLSGNDKKSSRRMLYSFPGAVLSSSVCAEHDAFCEAVDEKVII